jgi:hypothetical protein
MTRLKRWESPRREGRNDKGRGGSARKRQRQKQFKNLAKRLKQEGKSDNGSPDIPPNITKHNQKREGRDITISSLFRYESNQLSQKQNDTLQFSFYYGVLRSITAVSRSIAPVRRS